MKIHCLQHAWFEGPARIADWALGRRHTLIVTEVFRNQPLPAAEDVDYLVVMGGPMGVRDELQYPWLVTEKRLIEGVLRSGKPVLGICLGAQLLASVLGAGVYRNCFKEIGWFPVHPTSRSLFPPEFTPFHWHHYTFDLPAGAVHLAESDGCWNQAFRYERSLALQFHLESSPASVAALAQNCNREIGCGPFEQSAGEMLRDPSRFAALEPLLPLVLDRIQAGELF